MKHVLQNERGMALAIAIVALVIVGALIAGAFFSAPRSSGWPRTCGGSGVVRRGGGGRVRHHPHLGQHRRRRSEQGKVRRAISVPGLPGRQGHGEVRLENVQEQNGELQRPVLKLNDQLYLIDMSAQDTMSLAGRIRGGGASQRIGLLTRIRPVQINTNAALTSGGTNVVVEAPVSTATTIPRPGGQGARPSIRQNRASRYQVGDTVSANGHPSILGNPPTLRDPTLKDSAFSTYGDVTYTQMAASANITLPAQKLLEHDRPGRDQRLVRHECAHKLGEPMTPTGVCGSYFPVIHITGNGAVINGQEGQGILLVDGSLSVQGGFQFYGIVIIKGSLKTSGGGGTPAHFWGTVMVQDTVSFADTTNNISGNANLLYSKCAIIKALNKTGSGTMLRSRGWTQLY